MNQRNVSLVNYPARFIKYTATCELNLVLYTLKHNTIGFLLNNGKTQK